ncbi:hypothetical protein BDZ97DRAFT_2062483 [Flammula alnicola]|nr:hypothetical protein BDZ97DRAFT_2062483 [Flammula alnicola]
MAPKKSLKKKPFQCFVPQFPPDVYTVIVEQVAAFPSPSKSLSALVALSLASRSFRPLCQRQIFYTVNINTALYTYSYYGRRISGKKRMEDFMELLKDSPHLADYIRDLGFSLVSRDVDNPGLAFQFLSKLHCIRKFQLTCNACLISYNPADEKLPSTFDWRKIDSDLAATLLGIIQSPSLRSLGLEGFNHFPSQALFSLKTSTLLVDLSIDFLHMDAEGACPRNDDDSSRPQIKKYRVGAYCDQVATAFLGGPEGEQAVFDFSHVEKLSFEWLRQADADAAKAIMQSARRIQDLQCTFSPHASLTFEGLADMIMYGSSQTLRNLEVIRFEPELEDENPSRGLIEELKLLSGNVGVLESITLRLTCGNNMPYDMSDKCKVLDALLSDEAAFPRLRKLSLDVVLSVPGSGVLESWDIENHEEEVEEESANIQERCFTCVAAIPGFELRFSMKIDWV